MDHTQSRWQQEHSSYFLGDIYHHTRHIVQFGSQIGRSSHDVAEYYYYRYWRSSKDEWIFQGVNSQFN